MSGRVWVPGIPLPFLGLLAYRCGKCGRRFCRLRRGARLRYERHYVAEHAPRSDDPVQDLMEVTRERALELGYAIPTASRG